MVIFHKHSLTITILTLLFLPGCFIPSKYFMRHNLCIKPSDQQKPLKRSTPTHGPIITIWIHGTRLLLQSTYPSKNLLLPAHARQSDLRLKQIADSLIEADETEFQAHHFYLFHWSGKLCFQERETAAQQLCYAIEELLKTYQKNGLKPFIRIMGHSHGGNVALNMVTCNPRFDIDELILLACPVQTKTKHFIESPRFKSIYALYSTLDIIQILDPQGMYKHKHKSSPLFSNRQFFHQPNLAQMKIKLNRRAITHSEFAQPAFLKLLPAILQGIKEWHATITYKQEPNKISKLLCVYTK